MEKVTMKWLKLISGMFLVIAGVISVIVPYTVASIFIWVMSMAILLSGVAQLFLYLQNDEHSRAGYTLLHAALDILLGILLLLDGTASVGIALTWCFAVWFAFSGVSNIAFAFGLKKSNSSIWWLPIINGLLGILLAVFLFFNAQLALAAFGVVIGIYMLVYGIISVCDYLI